MTCVPVDHAWSNDRRRLLVGSSLHPGSHIECWWEDGTYHTPLDIPPSTLAYHISTRLLQKVRFLKDDDVGKSVLHKRPVPLGEAKYYKVFRQLSYGNRSADFCSN
jgi:hypothetical protein